jgi:hypothetical protein
MTDEIMPCVFLGFERFMAKLEKFKAEAEDFPDPEDWYQLSMAEDGRVLP